MGWIMVLLPIAMLALGFPFFLILLATSATVLAWFSNVPTTAIHQVTFSALDKYALLAVPFFLFAGDLMARGERRRHGVKQRQRHGGAEAAQHRPPGQVCFRDHHDAALLI